MMPQKQFLELFFVRQYVSSAYACIHARNAPQNLSETFPFFQKIETQNQNKATKYISIAAFQEIWVFRCKLWISGAIFASIEAFGVGDLIRT